MIKKLHLAIAALLTMFSTMSFAQTEVTIDLSTLGFENATDLTTNPITSNGVTLSFDQGSSSFAPKYYTSGTAARIYGGSSFTVAVASGSITNIKFTFGSNSKADAPTASAASTGTYDTADSTWTGSASSVTFTRPSGSGHWRLQKAVVTYTTSGETPVTVEAPTIDGTTPFTGSTTVTITVPENTTVYYTLDGQDPDDDQEALEYTAPFTLTETTTVSARAYDADNNSSDLVTKTFTNSSEKGQEANPYTPSEVLALTTLPTDTVYIKGIVVAAVSGTSYNNASYYISDDGTTTSQLNIYRGRYIDNADFTEDDYLAKGDTVVVKGILTTYNDAPELAQGNYIVTINGSKEGETTPEIDPTDKGGVENPYTPSEVLALTELPTSEVYVKGKVVSDVTGTSYNNATYYISDDGTETNELEVYRGKYLNNADFSTDVTLSQGDEVVVYGKLTTYNGTYEFAAGNYIYSLNGTTGINTVKVNADTLNEDAPMYNLAGQRVTKDYKGVVLQKGHKYLRK